MYTIEVKDVVCDYGVFECGELKLILNSRKNAERIAEILREDVKQEESINENLYNKNFLTK